MNTMYMIPEVIRTFGGIKIPIYGTHGYCLVYWGDKEDADSALKRANGTLHSSFAICASDLEIETEKHQFFEVWVYEIKCKDSGQKYFMISLRELQQIDDAVDLVCVPFNHFNLLKFYAEYLCPLAAVRYRLG